MKKQKRYLKILVLNLSWNERVEKYSSFSFSFSFLKNS